MKSVHRLIDNRAGWRLSLYQTWNPERFNPALRPVLIVPGYGMNSFIFSYHPRGVSMEGFLADAGFEVWRVDLRAQGGSVAVPPERKDDPYGLNDLALVDLPCAVDAVLENTQSKRSGRNGEDRRVDIIGASLGGTIMFVYASMHPQPLHGTLVSLGSPVRWVKVHPMIRIAFSSATLAGAMKFRGTRKLAEFALPRIAKRAPWLLSIYLNPEITDTSVASELVRTVEDPSRYINREMAIWIKQRDLIVNGRNLSEALKSLHAPLMCVVANGDGIVPPETASFAFQQIGSNDRTLVTVGDREIALAHADLFISNEAHARVFRPLADWLTAHVPRVSG